MPGPLPKPPELRQRRNRESTRATLPSVEASADREVPPLPPLTRGEWHTLVVEWWTALWKSPMAEEYGEADKHELYVLAYLHQDFYKAKKSSDRKFIASEIRQQGRRFGLAPMDRRTLQWEIERGEQASERVGRRRAAKAVEGMDPRDVLRQVK